MHSCYFQERFYMPKLLDTPVSNNWWKTQYTYFKKPRLLKYVWPFYNMNERVK